MHKYETYHEVKLKLFELIHLSMFHVMNECIEEERNRSTK